MLLALTHPPVCLLFSLSLSSLPPSLTIFVALLLHLLILIVSLAAAAAGSMQKPELSQHLVFIVVLVHEEDERGGIRGMLPCPLPASAGTAVANFTPNIILLS